MKPLTEAEAYDLLRLLNQLHDQTHGAVQYVNAMRKSQADLEAGDFRALLTLLRGATAAAQELDNRVNGWSMPVTGRGP